jgi:hypothetical protein
MRSYYFTADSEAQLERFENAVRAKGYEPAAAKLGENLFYVKIQGKASGNEAMLAEGKRLFALAHRNGCAFDGIQTQFSLGKLTSEDDKACGRGTAKGGRKKRSRNIDSGRGM